MEYDESEADPSDLIDQRGQGGPGGPGGGLDDLVGGMLGGGGAAAGGLGSVLGGMLGGRGAKAGGGMGLILVVVVGFFLLRGCGGGGFDLSSMGNLDELPGLQPANPSLPATGDGRDLTGDPQAADVTFANVVVSSANDYWAEEFERAGKRYERTKLVLYSGAVSTGCGRGSAAAGPFYCPADSRVYLDLTFWQELTSRFGAGGDFAQAYVIAHEVGHHVQNQLGISDEVQRLERRDPNAGAGPDGLSVRLELQADCLAGVWAKARAGAGKLEPGDIDEAIRAAEAVGDDTIQRTQIGEVRPDTFTHGTSERRMLWFRRGYDTGNADRCDTFSTEDLDRP